MAPVSLAILAATLIYQFFSRRRLDILRRDLEEKNKQIDDLLSLTIDGVVDIVMQKNAILEYKQKLFDGKVESGGLCEFACRGHADQIVMRDGVLLSVCQKHYEQMGSPSLASHVQ